MKSIFIDDDQFKELERILCEKKQSINYKLDNFIKKTGKNKRMEYEDLSFLRKNTKSSPLQIEDLINKKILALISEKEGRLTFTFKGLLIFDYHIKNPSIQINKLFDDLNKIFFDKVMRLSKVPMTSREKAIIIGLIGLTAITESYALKPRRDNEKYVKNAIDIGAKYIESLGSEFNDGSLSKLWTHDVIGEGPILGEFRRATEIPKRTEGIYAKKRKGHYLDLLANNNIDRKKLIYLLNKIFNEHPPSHSEKKNFIKILEDIKQYEFKLFKEQPPFKSLDIRRQIKHVIESNI